MKLGRKQFLDQETENEENNGAPTSVEILSAENHWIRLIQMDVDIDFEHRTKR